MNLKNKVAIVTGASSGIGLATAKQLALKGVKVALVARSKEKLDKLSKELPDSFVFVTDMRVEKEVRDMVSKVMKHFGRIDILVNNAGRGYDSPIEKIDIKNYKEIFALNILGPLIAMEEVIPIMRKQKKGAIVNISSGTALGNYPGLGAYSSLKRALVGLSLTAAQEMKIEKISVSVVYPFITDTDFYKNILGKPRGSLMPDRANMPKADTAQYVAGKIEEAIISGAEEVFVHDWMKK